MRRVARVLARRDRDHAAVDDDPVDALDLAHVEAVQLPLTSARTA